MDIRNHHVGTNCQFGLRGGLGPEMRNRTDYTHVEDLENLDKVTSPSSNSILTSLHTQEQRGHVPFALLNLLLDPDHNSAIPTFVSESLSVRAGCLAHLFSSSIAVSTYRLSSSNCLPFNPRSRAMHTSAQESPSWTQSSSLAISA